VSRSRFALAALVALDLVLPGSAAAASKRRHFEPDDMELEDPGTLDIDLQAGPMRGDSNGKNRVLLPDFELGLGLLPNVQLEVDGAFSLDEFEHTRRHFSADPLWVATKLGLFDFEDEQHNVWVVGLELGPRLPTLDAAGVGYSALGLFGFLRNRVHLVLNAGFVLDPGPTLSADHSRSLVLGLDLDAKLGAHTRWSLQSELSGAYYFSADPHELAVTLGATYAVTSKLDVSATGLAGFLPGTDHAGLLLGVSPQFDLW
jgi:hypothetical protein